MPVVLVSNNSELLRHLGSPGFRRLELEPKVAASGEEAWAMFEKLRPPLAILDAEMAGISGSELTTKIKAMAPTSRVVLVVGKRLSGDQMRRIGSCGCDEVLVAPMSADELYDVVAIELGLPRRGAERYRLELIGGGEPLDATVTNLSIDGARVISRVPLAEGAAVAVRITLEDDTGAVDIPARIVWAQQAAAKTVAGAAFGELDDKARRVLARLTQWEIVHETQRTRVVLKGDFTEATRFDDLAPEMVGRVDFDMAQVTYMNSLGVRAWCEFLRAAPIQGYEFHACSVPFVLQASMVADVVGRGTVTSFFAPYHCESCDHQEERLLQSAALLASGLEAPAFSCSKCEGQLTFDDLPERYFAFLQPGD
ncbi:MAG: PilZ domain-containing protein [Myxococcales bacterium]|nr:PilZ domain-containing protein [Myxococcales bacterium]MBK7193493.1 PilZ domain-containing protein [Myxococcales bacterium]MBP6848346.1 PilZ domain-containing protein [Kofleriaceae bacterium]